ncbi:MAG: GNAT family N-acetyltransferase [Armatimonadetes bacterium]|nr:GNAT family N-acetyltransferase [Armatimonadota bacterium]
MDLPQLKMRRRCLRNLPSLSLPEGYTARAMRSGEEMVWAALLNSVGDLGEWTKERVDENLRGPIPPDHVFFIASRDADEPVATACIVLHHDEDETEAEVGWVAVRPDHQGRRLGYWVCLSVLHEIQKMNYDRTYLHTDDFRLPALKTYLNLGFEPDCWHESHNERWDKIRSHLG